MGCKAVFAANIGNICKKTNAADRPSPAYHEPRGVMQSFPKGFGLVARGFGGGHAANVHRSNGLAGAFNQAARGPAARQNLIQQAA
jgi:hypothetical protein